MVPIAEAFHVPLIEVTAVFTITLWLRLVGAVGSGWLADRIGRKTPLMISILWYSICNLLAGIAPNFRAALPVPCAARHRHGCGVARRRRARHGVVAGPLARPHERLAAGVVEYWLPAVEPRLRAALRQIGWRGLLI
jgi:Arabinose efflux permease